MKKHLTFVIENNEISRSHLAKSISDIPNMQTAEFKSAESALGKIPMKPDFIVLDHLLERANGIDCIPVFREFLPNAKIIISSSQTEIQTFESAFILSGDAYFVKDGSEAIRIPEKINEFISDTGASKNNWLELLLRRKKSKKKTKKIFILDDSANSAFIIEHLLSADKGDIVKTFTTSAAFITELNSTMPDLVVLDYNLEEKINGMDLLKLIKEKNPKTVVIILSGQSDVTIAADLIRKGAAYYLVKSFDSLKRLKSLVEITRFD